MRFQGPSPGRPAFSVDDLRVKPNILKPPPGKKKAATRRLRPVANSSPLCVAQDGVFAGLGHAEFDDPLGRDLDGRAGGRIAAHARLAVHQDKLAQAGNGEAVLGVLVGHRHQSLERQARLLLRDSDRFGHAGHDLRLRQRFCH
jgi:hypothetical protein